MKFQLTKKELTFIEESIGELTDLLEQLCKIPAPSNHEELRAEFCMDWLTKQGLQGVYIDEALNVVCPVNCDGKSDIVAFLAHTDTVFPDFEPLPYRMDEEKIYSPGVGDNTICLAIMLMTVKYLSINKITPKRGLLFVANAGEEGLGNLKGVKQIMKDFDGRIEEVYAFDGQYHRLANKCVGSHRYNVEVLTEGGHSFGDFGNKNAIDYLSRLIQRLYQVELPQIEDSKTTYNVGIIEGGTSVNTIAQQASMLYEYRSDSSQCLDDMKKYFDKTIDEFKETGVEIQVETVGVRPCAEGVEESHLNNMEELSIAICEKHSGIPCMKSSSSTDCNIPMSMGIPAVCVGLYQGDGAHTREEWLMRSSMPVGMKIAMELILYYCQ